MASAAEDVALLAVVRGCGRLLLVVDGDPEVWKEELEAVDGMLWMEFAVGQRCREMMREVQFEVEPRKYSEAPRKVLARSYRMGHDFGWNVVGICSGLSGLVDVAVVSGDGRVGNFLAVVCVDGLNGEMELEGQTGRVRTGDELKEAMDGFAPEEIPEDVMAGMRAEAEEIA